MIDNYKFKTDKNNQVLGELFENFLKDGLRQSGQNFTTLSIVRFIVSSLPLKNLHKLNKEPLKVIDYVCGAGHFLIECVEQITNILEKNDKTKDIKDYYKSVYGIEKENRLCKILKVIKEGTFDLIIANPPYSIKGFLETLSEDERKKYELYKNITENQIYTNNSIECFFIERAK